MTTSVQRFLSSKTSITGGKYIRQQAKFVQIWPRWSKMVILAFMFIVPNALAGNLKAAEGNSHHQGIADVMLFSTCGENATDVGGTIFRDYNANGKRDTREPAFDGSLGTITVTAYGSSNTILGTTTVQTDGSYILPTLDLSGGVRLEFTGLPAWLGYGAFGGGPSSGAGVSGTSVQFINDATCNADLGVNSPADYCQNNPYLATSCYVYAGEGAEALNESDALVSFPYTAGATDVEDATPPEEDFQNPTPTHLAFEPQLGTTYGLAWQRSTNTVYVAAFMKRHSAFGPDGPAAIYQLSVNPTTGAAIGDPALFLDLDTIFGANSAGADPHDPSSWFRDSQAFDKVGKISLGDLEISEDDKTLFTVNLFDKKLYAIPIDNNADTRRFAAPTPTVADCARTDVRPFALAVRDGRVFVGITCSAESTGNNEDLGLFVYAFDPNEIPAGSGDVAAPAYTQVLKFKGPGTTGMAYARARESWQPWTGDFASLNKPQDDVIRHPMPLLTDIEFDNGDMILGVRDRTGDMVGHNAGNPDDLTDDTLYSGRSFGDILRACYVNSESWLMESGSQSDASCVTSFGPTEGKSEGEDSKPDGPGEGEFYHDDDEINWEPSESHPEHTMGGMVQVPGKPDIVIVNYDPYYDSRNIGGVDWLNNTTGSATRNYAVFNAQNLPGSYGKTNGLGDLEAFCTLAPLEIGNLVWDDSLYPNGIQDPDEPGIPNVEVLLLDADGTQIASTTTDEHGEYYFNGADVSGGLKPNTTYEIRILLNQTPLLEFTPTTLDATVGDPTNPNIHDSDGQANGNTLGGTSATHVFTTATTTDPGYNDHTYDFGFVQGDAQRWVNVGNRVWWDDGAGSAGVANNGIIDGDEQGISGVVLGLFDSNGNPVLGTDGEPLTSTTDDDGYYLFDHLMPGDYRICVDADNFATANVLYNAPNSDPTEANPNDNGDINDNGIADDAPVSNGICSGQITLNYESEPTNETDRASVGDGSTTNANSNLTIDFGFVRVPTALEFVNEPEGPQISERIFFPLIE